MKNATLLLSVLASATLASCAGVSPTRIIGNTVGAAGGALIGNKLSNGDPLISAAGAGAGVLLSESLQAGSNAHAQKSYDAGYEKARSDSAKQQFQTLIDSLNSNRMMFNGQCPMRMQHEEPNQSKQRKKSSSTRSRNFQKKGDQVQSCLLSLSDRRNRDCKKLFKKNV
jgi:hypothetical protein